MDKAFIFEIIEAFSSSGKIEYLKIETEGFKIELGSRYAHNAANEKQESRTDLQDLPQKDIKPVKDGLRDIKSPIVGTFYERSAPDAAPYVTIGQKVAKGDVLCIVEAMKMMNEIECDFEGVVSEILVKNGDMVEFDQVIMRIEEK